jgi:hypothetical protein
MNWKKWLLSGLAGLVVMFALSGLWYQVLTPQQHRLVISRTDFLIPYLIAGYLVLAFLMAKIYPLGYKGGSPVKEGLVFGGLIGLILGLSNNLIYYAVWSMPGSLQLIDSLWQIVEKSLGGLAIALVWGRFTEAKKN